MTHPTCAKDDCPREPFARGYCGSHYQWARRHGIIQKIEKPKVCIAPGCGRPVKSNGWCSTHQSRIDKTGDPQIDVPIKGRRTSGCAIRICADPSADGKLCRKHLEGIERSQHPDPARRKRGLLCTVKDCDGKILFRGWCSRHYSRWTRHGDVFEDIPRQIFTDLTQCSEVGCNQEPYCKGRCRPHYRRHLLTGRIRLGPEPTPEEVQQRIERDREYHRNFKAAEYRRDPERVKARRRAWMLANPGRAKLLDARKRKKRRLARASRTVPYTADQLKAKIEYWGGRCWMCGDRWEAIDHVKPLSRGGWEILSNLRPACGWCNSFKHNKWPFPTTTRPEEYFARQAAA